MRARAHRSTGQHRAGQCELRDELFAPTDSSCERHKAIINSRIEPVIDKFANELLNSSQAIDADEGCGEVDR
ncbi:hypothetical protein, partial [Roseateles sp. P5_E8]